MPGRAEGLPGMGPPGMRGSGVVGCATSSPGRCRAGGTQDSKTCPKLVNASARPILLGFLGIGPRMTDRIAKDRLEKLEQLRAQGVEPFPPRIPAPEPIAGCLADYAQRAGQRVTVAGRLT